MKCPDTMENTDKPMCEAEREVITSNGSNIGKTQVPKKVYNGRFSKGDAANTKKQEVLK